LVAGCGTAARLDFKGHNRPATPEDVSVYLGAGRPVVDPRKVRQGPVLFNMANQTGKAETVSIAAPDGRLVTHTVLIPAGGTGQLKATLTLTAYGVERNGRPSMASVSTEGPARTGNNDLLQP
jgi:hypothetical protein